MFSCFPSTPLSHYPVILRTILKHDLDLFYDTGTLAFNMNGNYSSVDLEILPTKLDSSKLFGQVRLIICLHFLFTFFSSFGHLHVKCCQLLFSIFLYFCQTKDTWSHVFVCLLKKQRTVIYHANWTSASTPPTGGPRLTISFSYYINYRNGACLSLHFFQSQILCWAFENSLAVKRSFDKIICRLLYVK